MSTLEWVGWVISALFALRWAWAYYFPCSVWGHQPPRGYYDMEGGGYLDIRMGTEDGIGRLHAGLWGACERCGENHRVGQIHVPRGQ